MSLLNLLTGGSHRTPIGLDVGSKTVKAVQFEPASDGPLLVAAMSVARTGEGVMTAREAAGLPALFARAGFKGRRIILAAPSAALIQSPLELPPRSSQAPLDQIAKVELARAHRCLPNTFELGLWDLPPGRPGAAARGTQVMAVGLPHAQAESLLNIFEQFGLRVEALDVASCALARAAASLINTDQMTALLDIGWNPATLSVVYRGVVTFGRTFVDASLERLHADLKNRLGLEQDVADYLLREVGMGRDSETESGPADITDLPDEARVALRAYADALVSEMVLSFSYAAQQYPDAPVAKILLTGGGAAMPGLAGHLAAMLGIEVETLTPARFTRCIPGLAPLCSSTALSLACGLAQFPEV